MSVQNFIEKEKIKILEDCIKKRVEKDISRKNNALIKDIESCGERKYNLIDKANKVDWFIAGNSVSLSVDLAYHLCRLQLILV